MNKYFIAILFYAFNCSYLHAAVLKVTNMTNYPLVVQRRNSSEKEKFKIEEQKMISPLGTVKLDSGANPQGIKLLSFLAPKEEVISFIKQIADESKNPLIKEIGSQKIEGHDIGRQFFEATQQIQEKFKMPESWAEIATFNPEILSTDLHSEVIFGAPNRIFKNSPKALVIFEIVLITVGAAAAAVAILMALTAAGVKLAQYTGLSGVQVVTEAAERTSKTAPELIGLPIAKSTAGTVVAEGKNWFYVKDTAAFLVEKNGLLSGISQAQLNAFNAELQATGKGIHFTQTLMEIGGGKYIPILQYL